MSGFSFRYSLSALVIVGVMLAASASALAVEVPSLDAYAGEAAILGSSHRGHGPRGGGASNESSGLRGSGERSGSSGSVTESPQSTHARSGVPHASTNTPAPHRSRPGSTSTAPRSQAPTGIETASVGSPLLGPLNIVLLLLTCAVLLGASLLIRRLAHRAQ
jgi:hypothetical protein